MVQVGYIGLGVMGTPMSSNLLRRGFMVTVFDIDQSKVPPLLELGAKAAGSIAEVSEASDVVITMLPDSPHVEQVVSGPGGLIDSGHPGMIVMDTSTIFPGVTDALAEKAKAAGMTFVDAAVGRLPPQAIAGTSMFMVGGEPEDVERVRPVLEAMGNTIVHCGPVGSGIRCKLVNNFLTMVTAKANAEALAMATKAGLSSAGHGHQSRAVIRYGLAGFDGYDRDQRLPVDGLVAEGICRRYRARLRYAARA